VETGADEKVNIIIDFFISKVKRKDPCLFKEGG